MPLAARRSWQDEAAPRRLGRAALVLLALLPALAASPAAALDPELEIAQYGHRSWSARDGDFRGSIQSIAQTTDGYLWLGTGFGLLRYDGARFQSWQPPAGGPALPGMPALRLLGARDGSLWIGGTGLARWRDGKLTRYPELDGVVINALREDREGTVWVGGFPRPQGPLCAIAAEVTCFGEDGSLGDWVRAIHEDGQGRLWVAASGNLWRWRPGAPRAYPEPRIASMVGAFAESPDGELLAANGQSLRRLAGDAFAELPLAAAGKSLIPTTLMRDRDGGLWIGTSGSGLAHLSGGRVDRFTRADGLSSDAVQEIFEDREGNVWVATLHGLDQFRRLAVPTLTMRQGLASERVNAVLAARGGGLFVATADGLYHRPAAGAGEAGSRVERRPAGPASQDLLSLFEDRRGRLWISTLAAGVGVVLADQGRFAPFPLPLYNVFQVAEDGPDTVWAAAREQGLVRVNLDGELLENYSWKTLGNRSAISIAPDARRGGIWLGFSRGGVGFLAGGRLTETYEEKDGLGRGQVRDLQLAADGALWAATQGGLSRLAPGAAGARATIETLGADRGLPCDGVHWMRETGDSAWLYTACGLVRIARAELAAWVADPRRPVALGNFFDHTDGVENLLYNGYYTPYVAQTADGRFFFATPTGLATFDPRRLQQAAPAPPVHVELVAADGIAHLAAGPLRLPPRVRDLRIDYTAASFAAPDKVRFRFRLEGYDPDWQEAGGRRQAFYREPPPGKYTFRVTASNGQGVWNEPGAALELEILPAYYQTGWFRLLAAAAALGLTFGIYRWRVGQVTAKLAWQFEERLAERTRIANELHDTLLQGFISAAMQLSVAFARLPADLPDKDRLDRVLALMRRVIDEGRDAVRGLRAEAREEDDLARAFARIPGELGLDREIAVRTLQEDRPRRLHPIVRDEVYRIGREALVNALRHARAANVGIDIEYRAKAFCLRIADDGIGIERATLENGRPGHWGIAGMHERALRLAARFAVTSTPGQGTLIELNLPAGAAYERPDRNGRRRHRPAAAEKPGAGRGEADGAPL